jgi:hypothetical protein
LLKYAEKFGYLVYDVIERKSIRRLTDVQTASSIPVKLAVGIYDFAKDFSCHIKH